MNASGTGRIQKEMVDNRGKGNGQKIPQEMRTMQEILRTTISQMPALPSFKDTNCKPLEITGLEYYGLITLKAGDVTNMTAKKWACTLTSLVTRNIHLEIVFDLSTTAFLIYVRQLFSIGGHPRIIYSDNATHFKAAGNALAEF